MRWNSSKALRPQRGKIASRERRLRLTLEALETRLAPVIGGSTYAPPVMPGGIYDGVVQVNDAIGPASGTLMTDGLHILTAGHVANNTLPQTVIFDLAPSAPGRVVPPIQINVPVGPNYQVVAPGFVNRFPWPNDISILRLTDQVTPSANRLLVAPYYGPQIGYPVVANGNDDLNNPFTLVGYGLTGAGTTGLDPATPRGIKRMGMNSFDADANLLNSAVQTVGVTGNPIGGNFRLRWMDAGGNVATTGDIPFDAPANGAANSVQTLLQAARTPGGDTPLAGNVMVNGFPGIAAPGDSTTWFISFTGALAGTNVAQVMAFDAPGGAGLVAPPAGAVGVSQSSRLRGAPRSCRAAPSPAGTPPSPEPWCTTLTIRTPWRRGQPPASTPWDSFTGATVSVSRRSMRSKRSTLTGPRPPAATR
jgi:hypothetical protein